MKIGRPVMIWDANGRTIDRVIEADTETGECLILGTVINPATGQFIQERKKFPAPLAWTTKGGVC